MALLSNVPVYATDNMLVDPTDNRHLIVDASGLGVGAGRKPFTKLYDDACDLGCVIRSHRTGNKYPLTLLEGAVDEHAWRFEGSDNTGQRIRLTILND